MQASELVDTLALEHPRDRNGKVVQDRWSSAELEDALNAYREACYMASKAVRVQLCNLARDMQVTESADALLLVVLRICICLERLYIVHTATTCQV